MIWMEGGKTGRMEWVSGKAKVYLQSNKWNMIRFAFCLDCYFIRNIYFLKICVIAKISCKESNVQIALMKMERVTIHNSNEKGYF